MIRLSPCEGEPAAGGAQVQRLRRAALQDDERQLERMLRQESYRKVINCRGGWGVAGTPLHAAVSRGHLSCLKVLLRHGALVDGVDVKAQTPLFAAVRGKFLDCVLTLLRAGADPNGNPSNNSSPVLTAAREGDAHILRQLLLHGAKADSRGSSCSSVLLWSSSCSSSSRHVGGFGPLYLAAAYGHLDCFKLLLLHGADPDYNRRGSSSSRSSSGGRTVLEMCVRHGCGAEYVELLIEFGANVYLPTLILEKTTKQNEAVELLLRERACPKTLTCLCRLSIRRHLNSLERIHLLQQLELPPPLMHFLLHRPRAATAAL